MREVEVIPVEWLAFLLTGAVVAGWCWRRREPFLERAATAFMVACATWVALGPLLICPALALGFRPPIQTCFAFSLLYAIQAGLLGVASWFTSPKAPEGSGLSPSEESS